MTATATPKWLTPELRTRLDEQRRAQGLPRKIEDRSVYVRIASIVRAVMKRDEGSR